MDVEPGRPANDDWRSAAHILQAAQARPSSRKYYVMAGIASAVWVVLRPHSRGVIGCRSCKRILRPALLALVVTFVAPVGFFFAVAHMVARSQEMRVLTQSMTEVAIAAVGAGRHRARIHRHGRSGHPPRSGGDGRWRRTGLGARCRTRSAGAERSGCTRARLQRQRSAHSRLARRSSRAT